jgi:chromosomal replication initiator protein
MATKRHPAPATSQKRLWATALPRIRSQVGEHNFATWIAPLLVTEEETMLSLAAPDAAASASVNRHFVALISRVLSEISGRPCHVRVCVREAGATGVGAPPSAPSPQTLLSFQQFVVGPSNREAYEHAVAISRGEFLGPSPLVLCGGVGLGKTHLAYAIADAVRRGATALPVICEPGTDFVDRLLAAVQDHGETNSWTEVSRAAVLILDDVHFLSGQAETQEALLQVFSILHERGTPVVLTSDRVPREIADIEERLRRRFEGGVLALIRPPEQDLRRRILLQKAADRGVALSEDVAEFLAGRIVGSGRALEGALTRVCAHASNARGGAGAAPLRVTRAAVAAALRVFDPPQAAVTPELVAAAVAEAQGVPLRGLSSRRRTHDVTVARQLAMYLCRKLTRLPLVEIAHRFGRRDHSTVLHACEVVESRRTTDPAFAALIEHLHELIRTRAR